MTNKELILLAAFLVTAYCVYSRVVSNELNLTTGVLLLSALGMLLFFSAEMSMRVLNQSEPAKQNIRLLIASTVIALLGADLVLRLAVDAYPNYAESSYGGHYKSVYAYSRDNDWFHVNKVNAERVIRKVEFEFIRKTNSLGLSERDIPAIKREGEYRILALGDSFTEGVGTTYESTWVKVMENKINGRYTDRRVTAINAGIAGSDVLFEYMLLKERLIHLQPDLVIVAINSTDILDMIKRGGAERFRPNGTLSFSRQAPAWEWLYATYYPVRHIVRGILNYNHMLLDEAHAKQANYEAINEIRATLYRFSDLSRHYDLDTVFVFHPVEWEVKQESYAKGFASMIASLEREQAIDLIDVLAYFKAHDLITKENSSNFYWKLDQHFNTQGYRAMGNAIATQLVDRQLLPVDNSQVAGSVDPYRLPAGKSDHAPVDRVEAVLNR